MGDQTGTPGEGTVAKAAAVLDLVADLDRPVRFSELLAQSPLPKATLYRLVQSLTATRLLQYSEDRQTYAPGLRLVRLAHAAWRQSALAPIARPFIDALSDDVGETVHLAQLDGGQVLYVDKRNATQPIEMFSQAGKIGPGYCTGVGKAMMAFLDPNAQRNAIERQAFFRHTPNTLCTIAELISELSEIRAEGVAYDREEHEPGIICVAAPIRSERGRVLGGLSVTTATSRKSLADLSALAPQVVQTAHGIAQAAETWQFPTE